MKGVMILATVAMRLIPPITTRPSSTAMPMPLARGVTGKAFPRAEETPLDCTVVRKMPQESTVTAAKTIPSQR